jgi:hypothetical protein
MRNFGDLAGGVATGIFVIFSARAFANHGHGEYGLCTVFSGLRLATLAGSTPRICAILLLTAVCGMSCSRQDNRMQTFSIGSTRIDLPDFLGTRIEDDTLVAYPPHTDFANLRFTVITVSKEGQVVSDAGEQIIRERAIKAGARLHEATGKVWYCVAEPASEGSAGSLMHYWYVGMNGHSLMVSCFVDAAKSGDPVAQRVLAAVVPAIHSFRGNTN